MVSKHNMFIFLAVGIISDQMCLIYCHIYEHIFVKKWVCQSKFWRGLDYLYSSVVAPLHLATQKFCTLQFQGNSQLTQAYLENSMCEFI